MSLYRFSNIKRNRINVLFPLAVLYSFMLLVYTSMMLAYLASAFKLCQDNKSIVLDYQANLPQISFDSDFGGDLSELMPTGADVCQIHNSEYKLESREDGGYAVIGGEEYPVTIVFADIDEVFAITDGKEVWIAKRPSSFEVFATYRQRNMTYLPEICSMLFDIPLGLIVLPSMYLSYKKQYKISKIADFVFSVYSSTLAIMGMFLNIVCVFCF